MHRFFLAPEETHKRPLILAGDEANHALRVLRIRSGESVVVLDGVGGEFQCRVLELQKRTVLLEVLNRKVHIPSTWQITLLQGVPKGKTMDFIVQKAVELGASRIIPLLTQRSEVHLSPEDSVAKAEKWQITAQEALKQSGNPFLPHVAPPTTIAEFLKQPSRFDLSLLASLQPGAQHMRAAFDSIPTSAPNGLSVGLWVGPEGDFSPEEIHLLEQSGAISVTLGSRVLRSETAALYGLSVIQHEMSARLTL